MTTSSLLNCGNPRPSLVNLAASVRSSMSVSWLTRRLIFGSIKATAHATRKTSAVRGLTPSVPSRRTPPNISLTVVALLNSRIEVAVLVQRNKELGQQLSGGRIVEAPSLNIVPQVRPQILIKPAETAVVMPAQPEHGMANPQKLERFMECAGGKTRDLVKNYGNILSPTFPRGSGIPGGKC